MITRMSGGTFLVTLCGIVIGALPISVLAGNPSVVHEVKHDRSQPLRDLAALAVSSPPSRHVASFAQATGSAIVGPVSDTVAQIPSTTPMQATVILNFDGLSAADTVSETLRWASACPATPFIRVLRSWAGLRQTRSAKWTRH